MSELPDDYWRTYVYVNFGWLCCSRCEVEPDLQWAWPEGEGEWVVEQFAIRAVPHLRAIGWVMHEDHLVCPNLC